MMMTMIMLIMMIMMMLPPLLLSSFTGCGGDGASSRNNSSGEAFTLFSFNDNDNEKTGLLDHENKTIHMTIFDDYGDES